MPNWVDNTITVSFRDEDKYNRLKELCAKHNNTRLFECVLPRPESEEENWYNWNTSNWGTKWEMDGELYWDDDGLRMDGSFNSAWGPPIGVYEALFNHWDADVEVHYVEPGMSFCGIFVYNLDTQTHNTCDFDDFKKYVRRVGQEHLTEAEADLWNSVKEYLEESDDDEN